MLCCFLIQSEKWTVKSLTHPAAFNKRTKKESQMTDFHNFGAETFQAGHGFIAHMKRCTSWIKRVQIKVFLRAALADLSGDSFMLTHRDSETSAKTSTSKSRENRTLKSYISKCKRVFGLIICSVIWYIQRCQTFLNILKM